MSWAGAAPRGVVTQPSSWAARETPSLPGPGRGPSGAGARAAREARWRQSRPRPELPGCRQTPPPVRNIPGFHPERTAVPRPAHRLHRARAGVRMGPAGHLRGPAAGPGPGTAAPARRPGEPGCGDPSPGRPGPSAPPAMTPRVRGTRRAHGDRRARPALEPFPASTAAAATGPRRAGLILAAIHDQSSWTWPLTPLRKKYVDRSPPWARIEYCGAISGCGELKAFTIASIFAGVAARGWVPSCPGGPG